MPARPFEDPDALYHDYRDQVMPEADDEKASNDRLARCLRNDAKNKLRGDVAIPSFREFFKACVFPLINDVQRGHPVPNRLAAIGLNTTIPLPELHQRLSQLLITVSASELSTALLQKLNAALVDWVRSQGYKGRLPVRSFYTERLIGWEALLLWHYWVTTHIGQPPSVPYPELRSGLFQALNHQWQHSRATHPEPQIPGTFRFAVLFTAQMMDALQDNRITWLAVFSKCVYAAEGNAELANTSDPEVRGYALRYLEAARSGYLKGSAAKRVSEGIAVFSAYARTPDAQLGRNPRGRPPSDPEAARAAAAAKLCMWGCPYRDAIQDSIPASVNRLNNPPLWELLLTALLLYPLSRDVSTVHRWLKHLDEGLDQETLGGMRIVEWHNQLEKAQVAVFQDIVREVRAKTPVDVAEEWLSFWKTHGCLERNAL